MENYVHGTVTKHGPLTMQYINFTNLIGPSVFLVLFNRDPIDVVVRVVVIIVRLAEIILFT